MPTINPSVVPTITPGNIFERLTEDNTLNVQWLTALDPCYYEALNRPMADITLRQLIIAKALDDINLRISHQALFPFLITAKIATGSGDLELPTSWIWDMHVSLPKKWEYIRLAKIKRISGSNTAGSSSDELTGILRFIFSGQESGSTTETYLFYADYQIDSVFTYQYKYIQPVSSDEETVVIDAGELETIGGQVVFRTLDTTDSSYNVFLKALAPPSNTSDSNGDGIYDSPAVYEMKATPPGGITQPDDFLAGSLNHGTGILVSSAVNSVPSTDSDFNTWLSSNNYPFRIGATRTSIQGITIPSALFREFSIVAPAFDEETGDTSLQNHPVYVSRIERLDDLATQLKFYFTTHTITPDGTPDEVEFATLTLHKDWAAGRIVNIEPNDDLLSQTGSDQINFRQGFGMGHVVLSTVWGSSSDEVDNFFESFLAILDVSASTTYVKSSSILSSYGICRVPAYTPTKGQWEALSGSSARRDTPLNPSDSNRFITESDEGLGDAVDFRTLAGFPDDLRENEDFEPIAYKATSIHKLVKLVINSDGDNHDYNTDILPRLRCLFGRDPVFGDEWYNGTYFMRYNGDAWQNS